MFYWQSNAWEILNVCANPQMVLRCLPTVPSGMLKIYQCFEKEGNTLSQYFLLLRDSGMLQAIPMEPMASILKSSAQRLSWVASHRDRTMMRTSSQWQRIGEKWYWFTKTDLMSIVLVHQAYVDRPCTAPLHQRVLLRGPLKTPVGFLCLQPLGKVWGFLSEPLTGLQPSDWRIV